MKLVVDGEIYQRQRVGGISRIYNEVLPRLCDLDPALAVTLLTDGRLKQALPTHPAIRHRPLPQFQKALRPGRLWGSAPRRLKRITRNLWTKPQKIDIWQATFYSPPAAWPGPFVVMFHDLMEERFPQFFDQPRHQLLRRNKQACARQADLIICNSKTTQQDVCAYYGVSESKTCIVNLAAAPLFRRLSASELDTGLSLPARPFFLTLGNRSAYKNFEFLLRAYADWPARHEIALVVVGPPFTSAEQALVDQLSVNGKVFLYAGVDDATLCRLYNLALAFVYPSLYEGFGIPLLEAMACGCPIVASRIPTTAEVAGDLPLYFDPTDAGSLQAAMTQATAIADRAQLQRQGYERSQAFSWDATARQFLAIYHQLAGVTA